MEALLRLLANVSSP